MSLASIFKLGGKQTDKVAKGVGKQTDEVAKGSGRFKKFLAGSGLAAGGGGLGYLLNTLGNLAGESEDSIDGSFGSGGPDLPDAGAGGRGNGNNLVLIDFASMLEKTPVQIQQLSDVQVSPQYGLTEIVTTSPINIDYNIEEMFDREAGQLIIPESTKIDAEVSGLANVQRALLRTAENLSVVNQQIAELNARTESLENAVEAADDRNRRAALEYNRQQDEDAAENTDKPRFLEEKIELLKDGSKAALATIATGIVGGIAGLASYLTGDMLENLAEGDKVEAADSGRKAALAASATASAVLTARDRRRRIQEQRRQQANNKPNTGQPETNKSNTGQNVTEVAGEVVEEVAEETVEEVAEETAKAAAATTTEQILEEGVKEVTEETVEETATKAAAATATEQILEEGVEEVAENGIGKTIKAVAGRFLGPALGAIFATMEWQGYTEQALNGEITREEEGRLKRNMLIRELFGGAAGAGLVASIGAVVGGPAAPATAILGGITGYFAGAWMADKLIEKLDEDAQQSDSLLAELFDDSAQLAAFTSGSDQREGINSPTSPTDARGDDKNYATSLESAQEGQYLTPEQMAELNSDVPTTTTTTNDKLEQIDSIDNPYIDADAKQRMKNVASTTEVTSKQSGALQKRSDIQEKRAQLRAEARKGVKEDLGIDLDKLEEQKQRNTPQLTTETPNNRPIVVPILSGQRQRGSARQKIPKPQTSASGQGPISKVENTSPHRVTSDRYSMSGKK
jgi:hypothetical protein